MSTIWDFRQLSGTTGQESRASHNGKQRHGFSSTDASPYNPDNSTSSRSNQAGWNDSASLRRKQPGGVHGDVLPKNPLTTGGSSSIGNDGSSSGANYISHSDSATSQLATSLPSSSSFGPAEVIPASGCPVWESSPAQGMRGEYPYSARLLPCRALACGGSGFRELRVINRDTLLI
ncbi:unnamed protein product [Protopolystoma xenopodis]|uniref:Uncharacterized protein n=1 Tax=Protopolystoma xenopodis TaxID=117903 RepID=A0A3S5ATY6_9PLAT|nr:unnamed protein product [Protopolystoma xenopodis]